MATEAVLMVGHTSKLESDAFVFFGATGPVNPCITCSRISTTANSRGQRK